MDQISISDQINIQKKKAYFYLVHFLIQKQEKNRWHKNSLSWDFKYLKHIQKLLLFLKDICFSHAFKSEVHFVWVYGRVSSAAHFFISDFSFNMRIFNQHKQSNKWVWKRVVHTIVQLLIRKYRAKHSQRKKSNTNHPAFAVFSESRWGKGHLPRAPD